MDRIQGTSINFITITMIIVLFHILIEVWVKIFMVIKEFIPIYILLILQKMYLIMEIFVFKLWSHFFKKLSLQLER